VRFYCEIQSIGGVRLLAQVNEWRRRHTAGIRHFSIGYVPCADCSAKITTQQMAPVQVHRCRNRGDDPVCAYVIDARTQSLREPLR